MTTIVSAYYDVRCGDDMDPFGRDAAPLEVLAQDIYHLLITAKLSLLADPDWGEDLESYLGRPLPSTLAYDVEAAVRRDDRVSDARCTITKDATDPESYRLELQIQVDEAFVPLVLALTPDGIVRLG